MGISHRFDNEHQVHYLTVAGTTTIGEFRSFVDRLARSSDYRPDRNSIWDLRDFDFENVDADFWRSVVAVRHEFPERSRARLAHVVTGDFAYGMMRMYQILSEVEGNELEQTIGIFRDMGDAETWVRGG